MKMWKGAARRVFAVGLSVPLLLLSGHALARPKKAPMPPSVNAKTQAAQRFYLNGQLMFERGEFLEAARQLERAYDEEQHSALVYNIAMAYDRGGDRGKALAFYRKFLTLRVEPPSGEQLRTQASARADVLENELSELAAAKPPAQTPQPPREVRPSLPFVEPVTKHIFQTILTIDDKSYALLGAGARKVSLFKIYAMGLYVEDEPARKAFPAYAMRAGGSDRASLMRGDLGYQFILLGEFGKMAVLRFARAVTAKQTRDAYRELLGEDLSSTAPAQLKADTEAFLALFEDVREGAEVVIRTSADGTISVDHNGRRKQGPANLRLSHDIWTIWLGAKPISSDLKKALIDRIETLGH